MAEVEGRITREGDRFWRYRDFAELPPGAVAQAFSRLSRRGELIRVRPGLYYRPRPTILGPSRPSSAAVVHETLKHPMHPAGATAANLLGLSTQNPAVAEYATTAPEAPLHLQGVRLRVGRPRSREGLNELEGAVLETLRDRGLHTELDPETTAARLVGVVRRERMFPRLVQAAGEEPPRVRAMLGALGQELGADPALLERLRGSFSRLSRFDFGMLRSLRHAAEWQAR